MLLSTQTDVIFSVYGEEEGVKILADAGYDAIDYSMFYLSSDQHPLVTGDVEAHAAALRKTAEAAGIRFNQAHAPFPCWRYGDDAYNAKMPDRIIRSVKMAGILGAKAIVVHPIAYTQGFQVPGEDAAEAEKRQMEFNLNYYRSLEPIAKEYGVKVALENMWGHDRRRNYITPNVCSFAVDLARYFDALNSDAFTVCLDLGHCGLVGEEPDAAIRILGNRLGALHVHDNNYREDSHTIPYAFGCSMNWDAITKALGEINYQGDFTFEADNFLARFGRDALPAATTFMAQLGRTLCAKIEANRK